MKDLFHFYLLIEQLHLSLDVKVKQVHQVHQIVQLCLQLLILKLKGSMFMMLRREQQSSSMVYLVILENKECMMSSIDTYWTWSFMETVYDVQVDNNRVLIKADHVHLEEIECLINWNNTWWAWIQDRGGTLLMWTCQGCSPLASSYWIRRCWIYY